MPHKKIHYEREASPQIRNPHENFAQLSSADDLTGGGNDVNDEREEEGLSIMTRTSRSVIPLAVLSCSLQ